MKHGIGKKWYMNAKNYLANEVGDEEDLKNYLTEQWKYFETVLIIIHRLRVQTSNAHHWENISLGC